MDLSEAQVIELFHIAFLDALARRLDRTRYVLKGGANLRYFFGSQRYSQDIDLDFVGEPPWSVQEKVSEVIESRLLGALLKVAGLSVGEWSDKRQTDTTRRWKVGIVVPGRAELTRTKVEFSGRGGDERYRLEAVPERIVSPYALRAPLLQHYTLEPATEQKVEALALRTQVQSRDVFDLDLLLRRQPLAPGQVSPELLEQAAGVALGISFDAFSDQVLRFLEPEVRSYHDSAEDWERMQTYVAEKLEQAQ